MTKREAKILMTNSNLIDKKGILQKFYLIFSLYKKMVNSTYYQRNREIMIIKRNTTMKMIKKD